MNHEPAKTSFHPSGQQIGAFAVALSMQALEIDSMPLFTILGGESGFGWM